MADIFLKDDAIKLFKHKSILFLGDSIMRNIYQDFLTLFNTGKLTSHTILQKKGTQLPGYAGDELSPGSGKLIPGRDFREERELPEDSRHSIHARYYFLVRCWDRDLEKYLDRIGRKREPDLILVLSCLWDINRWGSGGIEEYKKNSKKLLSYFKANFPSAQVMWLTSPPISVEVRAAVCLPGMDQGGMRFNVMESNLMVATNAASHGYDVVDLHHYMMHQVHKRKHDGVHWTQDAVRFQTNLILTHYSLSRDIELPGREKGKIVEVAKKVAQAAEEGPFDIVVKDSNDNEVKKKRKKEPDEYNDDDDGKEDLKRRRPDSSSEDDNSSIRCGVL